MNKYGHEKGCVFEKLKVPVHDSACNCFVEKPSKDQEVRLSDLLCDAVTGDFTQAVTDDGVAILNKGVPMTPEMITCTLNLFFNMLKTIEVVCPLAIEVLPQKMQGLSPEIVDIINDSFEDLLA